MSRALIASSHPETAQHLQRLFSGEGFSCALVSTADDALREAHLQLPDVVVVHWQLAGLTSPIEVAGVLSRRQELRHAWVVALAPLDQAVAYHRSGVEAVESEPLDDARFLARLETARRWRQLTHETDRRLERLERDYRSLREIERNKDQLTQMLVHDFKNPISTIITALEDVLETHRPNMPPPISTMLRLAQEEAQHLLTMAANILDVRKMQHGKLRLDLVRLDPLGLGRLLELALADVGGPAHRSVRWTIPPDLPTLEADAEVLRRVFANLFSNAIKHTERTGMIEVSIRALENSREDRREDNMPGNPQDGLEIVFRDDGEGIPEEDLERIFDAFERSGSTTTTRFDTGMGLTFCKLAVEEHGGRIWAESNRGYGSSFFILLPQRQHQEDEVVELVD